MPEACSCMLCMSDPVIMLASAAIVAVIAALLRRQKFCVANVLAFALNVYVVQTIPRLDSVAQTQLPLNYVTPAPYAFAIWAAIYSLELVFVVWQWACQEKPVVKDLLPSVSPWWCAAHVCQVAWCFTFRPAFDTPQLLWISACSLSGIALCLSRAQHAILVYWKQCGGQMYEELCFYVPVTIHFGWTTAASLVNWNGYVARCAPPMPVKLFVACASALLGSSIGVYLTARREAPLYACTIAWAVIAVAQYTRTAEPFRAELSASTAAWLSSLEYVLGCGVLLCGLLVRLKAPAARRV